MRPEKLCTIARNRVVPLIISDTILQARPENCEKRLLASSCLSVCLSAWNNSVPIRRIFIKFYAWEFFDNLWKKFNFHQNLTRTTGSLHEYLSTFMVNTYLAGFVLEWKMFQSEVVDKIKTDALYPINFFPDNRVVYEIMWKNMVQPDRPQMTI
jgi:hypothetical protein